MKEKELREFVTGKSLRMKRCKPIEAREILERKDKEQWLE